MVRVTNAYQLLYRVCEVILEEPRRYYQDRWLMTGASLREAIKLQKLTGAPPCGTTACVAGWVVALHDGVEEAERKDHRMASRASEVLGAFDIGATKLRFHRELQTLFSGADMIDGWPTDAAARPGTRLYAEYGVTHIIEFAEEWKEQLEATPVHPKQVQGIRAKKEGERGKSK